jgi:hypothetical protein
VWCGREYFTCIVLCWLYFIKRSNIWICTRISVKVSLICSFYLPKSYMWKRSSVCSKWPFVFVCSTLIVSLIVSYACSVSNVCFHDLDILSIPGR